MVCPDWRPEHGSPSVAVCRPRRAESEEGAELERRGVGRYSPQDCSPDPNDEESYSDSYALECDCLSEFYTSLDNTNNRRRLRE